MRAVLLIGIHREELAFGEAVAAGLDPGRIALLRIPEGVSGSRPSQDQAFYYRTNHQELYLQVLPQVRGRYDLVLDLHAGVNEAGRCADFISGDRPLLECLLSATHPSDDLFAPGPLGHQDCLDRTSGNLRGVLLTDPQTPSRAVAPLLRAHTVIPAAIWNNPAFRYLGLEVFLPVAGPGYPADWVFARGLIEQALRCAGDCASTNPAPVRYAEGVVVGWLTGGQRRRRRWAADIGPLWGASRLGIKPVDCRGLKSAVPRSVMWTRSAPPRQASLTAYPHTLFRPGDLPMISNDMAARINAQINREFYSAYFYLGLSAQAQSMNLKGTAAWFQAKHGEEMAHAMKMYRYLIDQDAPVDLTAVPAPERVGDGVLRMFERTLEHERKVTRAINDMVDHALTEKDHATNIFLHWFVTEQIEEEATVNDIIGRLRLFGDQGQGLLMIDNELAGLAQQMAKSAAAAAAPATAA